MQEKKRIKNSYFDSHFNCNKHSSMEPDVRDANLDLFLSEYHKSFVAGLKAYGYDGESLYPLDQLKKDFASSYGHGFYWAIINAWVRLS